MDKFFEINQTFELGRVFNLNEENSRHAAGSLRLKEGNRLIVCDGNKNDAVCVLKDIGKKHCLVEIIEINSNKSEAEFKTVLFQALPKADKMDIIIQKAVELGVTEIVPVITDFTVSRPDKKSQPAKIERYAKISEAASAQSKRGIIPEIGNIMTLSAAIEYSKSLEIVLCCYENEKTQSLRSVLKNCGSFSSLGLFIGAEGGFSEREILLLEQNEIGTVSLGKRILRAETASLFALSCLFYEKDIYEPEE